MKVDYCHQCEQEVPPSTLNHPLFSICSACTLLSLHSFPQKRLRTNEGLALFGNLHFLCRICSCDRFVTYKLHGILIHACKDCDVAFGYPDHFTSTVKAALPMPPKGADWPIGPSSHIPFLCNLCQGGHFYKLPVKVRTGDGERKIKCCGGCSALFLNRDLYTCASVALTP